MIPSAVMPAAMIPSAMMPAAVMMPKTRRRPVRMRRPENPAAAVITPPAAKNKHYNYENYNNRKY
jgi:hypothetical protein